MGDVYRATDRNLMRQVAIKVLSLRHRHNSELRARFLREARAVASISHPNVVQVHSTGALDERPYIAMELLHGIDLGSVVLKAGPLSSAHAAHALLDAASGLQAAANAGIVHRDVKPSNLVLLENGEVKVTDFGLAKPIHDDTDPALTALGVVVGTPDYIAPEQARGDSVDERVDLYSLGGTLFFLLTGQAPYRTGRPKDDAYLKVVARHLNKPVPDPRGHDSTVDPTLAELTMALLSKRPEDRPSYSRLIAKLGQISRRLQADTKEPTSLKPLSETAMHLDPTPFMGSPKVDSLVDHAKDSPIEDAEDSTELKFFANEDSLLDLKSISNPLPKRIAIASLLACGALLTMFLLKSRDGESQSKTPAVEETIYTEHTQPMKKTISHVVKEPVLTPKGMILVKNEEGQPWFLIDKHPVSRSKAHRIFPRRIKKRSSNKTQNDVVLGLRLPLAEAYAATQNKRLPTLEEWRAAKAAGIVLTPYNEWAQESLDSDYTVAINKYGEVQKRKSKDHNNVTFRLVKELSI